VSDAYAQGFSDTLKQAQAPAIKGLKGAGIWLLRKPELLKRLGYGAAGAAYGGALVEPDATRQTKLVTPAFSALLATMAGPRLSSAIKSRSIGKAMLPATAALSLPAYHATLGDTGKKRIRSMTNYIENNMVHPAMQGAALLSENPKGLADVGADIAKRTAEDWKPTFVEGAKGFGSAMADQSARYALAATIPGLAGYLAARRLLPRSEVPEDRSIEEADEFYEAERKRQLLARVLGVGAGAAGLGATMAYPHVKPKVQKLIAKIKGMVGGQKSAANDEEEDDKDKSRRGSVGLALLAMLAGGGGLAATYKGMGGQFKNLPKRVSTFAKELPTSYNAAKGNVLQRAGSAVSDAKDILMPNRVRAEQLKTILTSQKM